MNVRDIMCNEVFTCRANDSLDAAARVMWEHDCGSVPVVDEGNRVIGMVTDRDVCMAAYTQGLKLAEIPVRTAMSQQVHSCSVLDALDAVESIMQQQQVRRVPVLDDDGHLVGIVSLNDIALVALEGLGSDGAPVRAEELARTLGSVCQPRTAEVGRAREMARGTARGTAGGAGRSIRPSTGAAAEAAEGARRSGRSSPART